MEASKKPPRQEFERKFLVITSKLPKRLPKARMLEQGYLMISPIQVRVRIVDGKEAYLEIKGPGHFESSKMLLPVAQARHLLTHYLAEGTTTIKKEHRAFSSAWKRLTWELHTFKGRHRGLQLAEIELPRMSFRLDREKFPPWIGKEVTGDPKYKNKNLAKRSSR